MQKTIYNMLVQLGLRGKNLRHKNPITVARLGLNKSEDASMLTAGRRGAFTEGENNNIRHNT